MTILFGPSGTGGEAIKGLTYIKQAGLDTTEILFVYGVKMTNQTAKKVGDFAKEIKLKINSVHAPYYINLASAEKPKRHASKIRIIKSAERAHHLKAKYIVFHPAFYGKLEKKEVYNIAKEAIIDLQNKIKEKKWNVVLCPETTGKVSQFGSLDELIKLTKETKCGLCVDFAHLYARSQGKINFEEVAKKIKSIKNLTCHWSGIEYGPKGERRHIPTPKDLTIKLLKALKKYNISTTIINESPQPLKDALTTKKIWQKLKKEN